MAHDDIGVKLSIQIALFKYDISQGNVVSWENVSVLSIGHEFIQTSRNCCADQGASLAPRILRAIIETIKSNNMPAIHALRTGSGANDPQRMRGTDKAQRRDIDREYHLHYWECDNGTIELSSIVHHNDFSIPE